MCIRDRSGTGNLKFAMNGALTIGTLDGANVEIRERVGEENFFLFGKTESEVAELWKNGYHPRNFMSPEVWEAINLVRGGHFSQGDKDKFEPLVQNLILHDPFCVMADFDDYMRAQQEVSGRWKDKDDWNTMSLLNIAGSGFFSSDRSIKEYCDMIWRI